MEIVSRSSNSWRVVSILIKDESSLWISWLSWMYFHTLYRIYPSSNQLFCILLWMYIPIFLWFAEELHQPRKQCHSHLLRVLLYYSTCFHYSFVFQVVADGCKNRFLNTLIAHLSVRYTIKEMKKCSLIVIFRFDFFPERVFCN